MHEYSIIQSLVGRVELEVKARRATAVHRLEVRVGELSGVEPELLASAYELFRASTICAAAVLEIVRVPARWSCRACEVAVVPAGPLRCGRCGGPASLAEGDELVLERIELEVP